MRSARRYDGPEPRRGEDAAASGASRGESAFLDAAMWRRLLGARDVREAAGAWLALQCRAIGGISRAGVAFVDPDGDLSWAAEWPTDEAARYALSAVVEAAIEKSRGVVRREARRPGHQATPLIAYPFVTDGEARGAVGVELDSAAPVDPRSVLRQLQWGAAWMEAAHWRAQTGVERQARERSALLLDLVAGVLEADGFSTACRKAATELCVALQCERVSIGVFRRGRVAVEALSHAAQFGRRMNLMRAIGHAMDEALDQQASVAAPPRSEDFLIRRAHEALLRQHDCAAVLTVPAYRAGRAIGAFTLEWSEAGALNDERRRTAEAAAQVLCLALEERRRSDRSLAGTLAAAALAGARRLAGPRYTGRKLLVAAMIGVAVFLYFARGDYRVVAEARLEGLEKRIVSVPFDGYVSEQFVRAGDVVRAGELLAVLDDRDLRLDRARWAATLSQREREYAKALGEHDRVALNVVKAQIAQARAELALVEAKLARTRILAPFDALVLSGDLSQKVGAPLARGDVMFELAPLEQYRVVLEVDERDVAGLKSGEQGRLLLASLPGETYPLRVSALTPIAEAKNGKNIFRVEGLLASSSPRLRPGMTGVAKVDVGERALVWIWFRKLAAWARVALWEVWP